MCLTDDMLKEAGIDNGMHRMMLLNRRNELMQATPPGSPRIQAAPSLLGPKNSSGSDLLVCLGLQQCLLCISCGTTISQGT